MRARRRPRAVTVIAAVAICLGLAAGVAGVAFPDQLNQLYGMVRGQVIAHQDEVRAQRFTAELKDLLDDDGVLRVGNLDDAERERVRDAAEDSYPSVTLGGTGDKAMLDRCDGTFTVMASYERDDGSVPPTAAAHNNCGGDLLLYWAEGQRVNVSGLGFDGLYEVVDIRHTSKIWSSTDDLVGLQGDLALQSCFYGQDQMKFVGLERILELPDRTLRSRTN